MKIDLFKLATDAGMTENEFKDEIGKLYATYSSLLLDINPGKIICHTVSFSDHDIVIETRRNTPIVDKILN